MKDTKNSIKKSKSHSLQCGGCQACDTFLQRLGLKMEKWNYMVALAGNPNTGKSTIFNAMTGLRQHTGNWPGKTVTRAEGGYRYGKSRYKLVDLPGTYSLLSVSVDEEIARDFILFGQPDCTVVVVDATCLERNLNLVLQIREISGKVVIALNLMDEAKRKKININAQSLAKDLGVPVVCTVAKTGEGLTNLLQAISGVVCVEGYGMPRHITKQGVIKESIEELAAMVERFVPGLPNATWVAIRLLEGDARIREALRDGDLASLVKK